MAVNSCNKQCANAGRFRSKLINNIWIYGIGPKTISAFFEGINVFFILHIVIALTATTLCHVYNIKFEFPHAIVFPSISLLLTFLIDIDFERREKALVYIAEFKALCFSLFLLSREWKSVTKTSDEVFMDVSNKITLMCIHLREYLQTTNTSNRKCISKIFYEDVSDLSILARMYQLNESENVSSYACMLMDINGNILKNFEKLKVLRDYRSPYTARAFVKLLLLIWPLVMAPTFVRWSLEMPQTQLCTCYLICFISTFINGSLQIVEDRLFDPFLGISCDDIRFNDLEQWVKQTIIAMSSKRVIIMNNEITITNTDNPISIKSTLETVASA